MKTLELTGLNENSVTGVVNGLQQLLADYQIYYTNLRGLHWHVVGKDFFVLHAEYEKMYDNIADKVDEIAERILMLGATPVHTFSDYLKRSKISETAVVTSGEEGIAHVMDSLKYFIASERLVLSLAQEASDEATVALMSSYISEQEKLAWMLASYKA